MGQPQEVSDRKANFPVLRASIGEATNPTATTVMADLGALNDNAGGTGTYEALVVASATALAEFSIQLRNANNSGNVGVEHIFYVTANSATAIPFRFTVELNQRLRVVMNANLTGDAVVNLQAQKVADL